jgi:4-diphosphocytidyl-2-C-methyl-D-erythritol kinase
VVFADLGDWVEVAPSHRIGLSITGPFAAHAPGDQHDLTWRAAKAFFEHAGLDGGAEMRVAKNLPAGTGFGGGSADAAAVLLALDELFATELPAATLRIIALEIGADVPMCLTGCALRARGVGDEISELADWAVLPLVLVWPGRTVSTAEVFRSLVRRDNPPLELPPGRMSPRELAVWLGRCRNDLEDPARAISPVIGAALEALRATEGCLLARMSGSGSGCFGLFETTEMARHAAAVLGKAHTGWWIRAASAR